jgi:hypothetical protein
MSIDIMGEKAAAEPTRASATVRASMVESVRSDRRSAEFKGDRFDLEITSTFFSSWPVAEREMEGEKQEKRGTSDFGFEFFAVSAI